MANRLDNVIRRRPLRAVKVEILEPHESERIPSSGAVGSVQQAEIELSRADLEAIWRVDNLELLARGYWAWLQKMFLGLVNVVYTPTSRTVVLISERLPLLRFGAPRFDSGDGTGSVTWPIERGFLVAREGRSKGHLQVKVERLDDDGGRARIRASVEVKNFYPGLRGRGRFARLGAFFYAQTQLRIHVLVCNAYLKALPRIDFPNVDTTSMPEEQPVGEAAS